MKNALELSNLPNQGHVPGSEGAIQIPVTTDPIRIPRVSERNWTDAARAHLTRIFWAPAELWTSFCSADAARKEALALDAIQWDQSWG